MTVILYKDNDQIFIPIEEFTASLGIDIKFNKLDSIITGWFSDETNKIKINLLKKKGKLNK